LTIVLFLQQADSSLKYIYIFRYVKQDNPIELMRYSGISDKLKSVLHLINRSGISTKDQTGAKDDAKCQ